MKGLFENKIVVYSLTFVLFVFIIVALALITRGVWEFPESFNLGIVRVHTYGALIALGLIIVAWKIEKNIDRKIVKHLYKAMPWIIVLAIIFGRIIYVSVEFSLFAGDFWSVFRFWEGGLHIYGAMLGGVLGLASYTVSAKTKFLDKLDALAIFFPLGHAVGRIANLVTQEHHGPPTDLPWGMYVHFENRMRQYIEYEYFHPAFLYEMIGNLVLFLVLYSLYKFKAIRKLDGRFTAIYCIGYGLIRFSVNFYRIGTSDTFVLFSQFVSVCLIIFGIIFLLFKYRKNLLSLLTKYGKN